MGVVALVLLEEKEKKEVEDLMNTKQRIGSSLLLTTSMKIVQCYLIQFTL